MEVTQLLPQELIVEILLWLPVKSLLRFRCLSKSFCALIDSFDFINTHISRSSQSFNLRKLIFQDRLKKQFHVCDWNLDLEHEILRLGKPVSSSWKLVYGHCKGLLLLKRNTRHRKYELFLWNPSTRQFRDLPDCPFTVSVNSEFYSIIGSGLGYDESTDEYKALFLLWFVGYRGSEGQVWVYGVKSHIWRRTQSFHHLEYDVEKYRIGCFADGSIHWLRARFTNRKEPEILAFDVGKETFSLVSHPTIVSMETELHVLEGSLCISYFSSSPLQADLYIRKNDEFGQFIWTQLYSITEPLFSDICWFEGMNVLGYSKGGDKILLDFGLEYMVSYDLLEKKFGKIGLDKDPNWQDPILCLESFVSVGGEA